MNRLVSEGVSSGVETRRILGSVVHRQGQTGADEDCDSLPPQYLSALF